MNFDHNEYNIRFPENMMSFIHKAFEEELGCELWNLMNGKNDVMAFDLSTGLDAPTKFSISLTCWDVCHKPNKKPKLFVRSCTGDKTKVNKACNNVFALAKSHGVRVGWTKSNMKTVWI